MDSLNYIIDINPEQASEIRRLQDEVQKANAVTATAREAVVSYTKKVVEGRDVNIESSVWGQSIYVLGEQYLIIWPDSLFKSACWAHIPQKLG